MKRDLCGDTQHTYKNKPVQWHILDDPTSWLHPRPGSYEHGVCRWGRNFLFQCVAEWCSVLQCICSVFAVCWSVVECVAVCCSVLQCVAVCWSEQEKNRGTKEEREKEKEREKRVKERRSERNIKEEWERPSASKGETERGSERKITIHIYIYREREKRRREMVWEREKEIERWTEREGASESRTVKVRSK